MAKKNFYEYKILEIKNLIANNEIAYALKLLNEELGLSYIPAKYEEEFTKLLLTITDQQKDDQEKLRSVNLDTFIEVLSSTNNFKLALALNSMHELNLNLVAQEIKLWIEDKKNPNRVAKIYMFESMAEQNIDLNIKFEKGIINPKQFGSIFTRKSVINVFHQIEKLTHKRPFFTNLVFQNFKAYLLLNYPKITFIKDIAIILIKVTEHMLDNNQELTKDEQNIYNQIKTLT